MFMGKPIIGLAGGIGSGKSRIAQFFGEFGCLVLDADAQVRALYRDPRVLKTLASWWGQAVFTPTGEVDRAAVARKVFGDPAERRRLEQLLHPLVTQQRDEAMRAASNDPGVVGYVWDIPLLFENGLDGQCDAIVFVDAPPEVRLERVRATRGWTSEQWAEREKLQLPLDKKEEISDYVVRNSADASYARSQVREILSRILSDLSGRPNRD